MGSAAHNLNFERRVARSPYMEWAKLCSGAKFNLATSGIANFPLDELGAVLSELEINGPSFYGYAPLIKAIASRYNVPKECVLTAAGTSMSNYLALAAAANPGEEVLVEQPTYELLLSAATYLGLRIERFSRSHNTRFQPDLADLRRKLTTNTRLIALTNLHNPSGVLVSEDVLREIAQLAKTAGARVLVDEVYLEMLFGDRAESSFHIDPECFIVTSSLTKAYGLSGLRCGWALAAPELVTRMWHINDLHSATPAFPAEQMSVAAFRNLEKISSGAETMLRTNRKLLREFLDSRKEFEFVWPEHGTIVFPRFRGDAAKLCSFLRENYETSVVPGRFFEQPDHIRLGVGGETAAVSAALEQLGRGLDAFKRANQ